MNRQGPRLKNGVDLQLQSAFYDRNWPVVIRLADKRAKTQKDLYYEIVKICAESQLDDPIAKYAAVSAVWQYAKDGTVASVDAIDLLEWATLNLLCEDDFSETLGPLRVRAVKAAPKDKAGAKRGLESCLLHWDLASAQQIAAIVDRAFPAERTFLFWNIVITHLLSISPQTLPEKRKLYGTLAQKQIERAAQATEQAKTAPKDELSKTLARGIQTEEEVLLLYDVVETHGKLEDFEKLVSSTVFSPLAQFRQGQKELLLRAAVKYSRDSNWEAVFKLCRDCLSETDDDGQPTLLASDFVIWQHLISSASHLKGANTEAQRDVQDLLTKLLASKHLRPMYRRNVLLARVSAAFNLGPNDENDLRDGRPASLRLRELIHYIDDQVTSAACFNDIKNFLEKLDAPGLKYLAYEHLPRLSDTGPHDLGSARTRLLVLKAQYFSLTCDSLHPRSSYQDNGPRCTVCDSEIGSAPCHTCLSQISRAGVDFYKRATKSGGEYNIMAETVPELAILLAFCSLSMAFHSPRPADALSSSAATRHLLHAVLLLEDQLAQNPGHSQLTLILVQLHLFLGSAYRASEIWGGIGVKRTIVDSLAPIFYDRLSTISPTVISPSENRGWQLMDLLKSHYHVSLKLRMPRRLIDAFEAGSYSSVMGVPKYIEDLRASCTRVMSLVEGRRAERFLGLPSGELATDPRFYEIHDDVHLGEVIDYGSFPAWFSSTSRPMHINLRIGPAPSQRRSHLSLLSEKFHDLLGYKLPSSYKVSTSAEANHVFLIESMSRLSNSFSRFLIGPDGEFTSSELLCFQAVSLLTTLILLCVEFDRSDPSSGALEQLTDALKASLEIQGAPIVRQDQPAIEHTVAMLSSMHNLAMLRDTAIATKLTTQWIFNFNEREKERDRSGRSSLPKEVVSLVKGLQSTAEAALKEGHSWITELKADVVSRDFGPKLKRWVFDGEDAVVNILREGSLPGLVSSWQTNVKGWSQVKWA